MKEMVVSEDIIPIGDFKKQASRLFRRVNADKRPILVTQNGRPVGVIVPPEDYDRLRERERLVAAVEEGLRQSEAGQLLTSEEVDTILDQEFGPLEDPDTP